MDEIAVRKREREAEPASLALARQLEPFRMLREFLRWDPFRPVAAPYWPFGRAEGFLPDVDVKETNDAYHLTMDLPGVKESDLELNVSGNQLTIAGKRDEPEEGATYYSCERSLGSFRRTFDLPVGADAEHVNAELKDGVLNVVIPKTPGTIAKRIPVSASASTKH
jgi:HSP20 family protein